MFISVGNAFIRSLFGCVPYGSRNE